MLEILKTQENMATLANAITNIAMSANSMERYVWKLWDRTLNQLRSQMTFSHDLWGGQRKKHLKLEVPMVPEETPRQWCSCFDTKLVMDSATHLKFTADIRLSNPYDWVYREGLMPASNMLRVYKDLSFTYRKTDLTLVITGEYALS